MDVAVQLIKERTFAHREQTGVGVVAHFGTGVGDVEVALGQLADGVRWTDRRV